MILGSSAHAPMSHPARPTRVNRKAVVVRGVPSRRSDAIARIAPAPAHTPSIAATIGCGQWRIAFTRSPVMRVKSSNCWKFIRVSGSMISCTSPPEQKLPPAPLNTIVRTSAAFTRSRNKSRNSAYDSNVSGFLRSGRLRVMTPTRPCWRQRKCCGWKSAMGAYSASGPADVLLQLAQQVGELVLVLHAHAIEQPDDPLLVL